MVRNSDGLQWYAVSWFAVRFAKWFALAGSPRVNLEKY